MGFGKKNKEKDKLNDKPVISLPSDFQHTVHVGYDPETGEFTGMPLHWQDLLQQSKISKQEQQQNPQAVLNALKYYTRQDKSSQKWMQPSDYDSTPLHQYMETTFISSKCLIHHNKQQSKCSINF